MLKKTLKGDVLYGLSPLTKTQTMKTYESLSAGTTNTLLPAFT
jgi:hypothetical protein